MLNVYFCFQNVSTTFEFSKNSDVGNIAFLARVLLPVSSYRPGPGTRRPRSIRSDVRPEYDTRFGRALVSRSSRRVVLLKAGLKCISDPGRANIRHLNKHVVNNCTVNPRRS